MISQNAEVDCGPWRNIETLCLMVCRDVLLSQGLSINSKNLRDLYDFVAVSCYYGHSLLLPFNSALNAKRMFFEKIKKLPVRSHVQSDF